MTTWEDWAKQADSEKIYLVELTVQKMSDKSTQTLYLSNIPYDGAANFYIPCVSGLPRLARQTNDTLTASNAPSWGDLEIYLELGYCPDVANLLPWSTILGSAYNLLGQTVLIKLGGPDLDEADFATIFSGLIASKSYDQTTLTLGLADKSADLDRKEVATYALPESLYPIPESNYGATVPVILGRVHNYTPTMIDYVNGVYMLAPHIVEDVVNIHVNGLPMADPDIWWTQKSVSPVTKTGTGSASMAAAGSYSGALKAATWVVEIDDVSAGAEIGQATFQWSLDNGVTWAETGRATVKWALDVDSLGLFAGGGTTDGTILVSGTYTGLTGLDWHLKIIAGGLVDFATFKISKDGGSTWGPEITTAATVNVGDGLTVEFLDGAPTPGFTIDDEWLWSFESIGVALADGISIAFTAGGGADFVVGDQWSFLMCSTLTIFGYSDDNEVLVDVKGKISEVYGDYRDTPGELIREIMQVYAGWSAAEIDTVGIADFVSDCGYTVGLKVDDPTSLSQVIDDLLVGIPAMYTVKLDGKFYLYLLEAPAGTPRAVLTDIELLAAEVDTDTDNIYRRVHVNYGRRWEMTNAESAITAQWFEWAKKDWSEVHAKDDSIADYYGYLAKDLGPLDTAIIDLADANTAAAALLALYKTSHDLVEVEVKVQPFIWEINDVVAVVSEKLNITNDFRVIGLEHDFSASVATVTLWR